jgi:hypothetical protein
MRKLIVFTGKHCKACHPFIEKLIKHGVKFTEVSVDIPDGAMMAAKHHVRSLPTSIIAGTSYVGNLPVNKIMEAMK